MKKKFFIVFAMIAFILSCVVYAEDTNKENSIETVKEESGLKEETETQIRDNSDLMVKVIRQNGETRTVIYSGLLGGYDDGAWCCIDFSKFKFALILTWNETDDTICIVPAENEELSNKMDLSIKTEANKAIYQKSVVQTATDNNLNIDISLMYDNAYSECVLNSGEELMAEVKVENTNEAISADVSVIIALYDENARLIGVNTESQSIAANDEAVISPKITVPADNTAANAKVMVWSRTEMIPYTNALMLTIEGSDYFGDDYNLAVNMNDRNTAVGMINSEDDTDIFEFKALKDGLYIFESYGTTDTYAVLSNKPNPDTPITADDNSGIDNNFRLSATLEAGNTYYLKVNGKTEGKYKIVSNYAIGNIFGTVSPVKFYDDDTEFNNISEATVNLKTYHTEEFVAVMHIKDWSQSENVYASFSLTGVHSGEYLVEIKRPGYLTFFKKTTLLDNVIDLGSISLIPGDVNGDNIINNDDIAIINSLYGKKYEDNGYLISADINADKVIDDSDIALVNANMGKNSNNYNENVGVIIAWTSISDNELIISGKAASNSVLNCNVFYSGYSVFNAEENCSDNGDFEFIIELNRRGTYTIELTCENQAYKILREIEN